MYVTQKNGMMVVAGEIIKSEFKEDRDGYMRAIYYIKTTGIDWTDPSEEKGAEDVTWIFSARDFAARLAEPNDSYTDRIYSSNAERDPEKYIAIEGIPPSGDPKVWRTKTNRPRTTIKLKALFAQFIDQERLINTVQYHPQGTMYSPWWRPDIFSDDDPDITGEYDDYGHDYGLGFQDDMRDDMEFFYEDERWSRD